MILERWIGIFVTGQEIGISSDPVDSCRISVTWGFEINQMYIFFTILLKAFSHFSTNIH
jgi:hypothetical protein